MVTNYITRTLVFSSEIESESPASESGALSFMLRETRDDLPEVESGSSV